MAVTVVFAGGVGTNITTNSGVDAPAVEMAPGKEPKVTTVEDAGQQIVDAVAKGTFRVLIGSDVKTIDAISRVSPRRAIIMIADQMKKLLG